MNREMKGVSGIVAAVILIALVVIIGVFISTWVMDNIAKQTSTTPTCSVHADYEIVSAKFKSSTNETRITVMNRGPDPIYGFSLEIENGTDMSRATGLTESPNTNATTGLSNGKSMFITYTSQGTWNRSLGMTATGLRVLNQGCPEVYAETLTITQIT